MRTMNLKTDLRGKVRNLPGFTSEALLPLFEAVVNSIQAIQEQGDIHKGEVRIQIIREQQMSFPLDNDEQKIIGFSVTDTGVGFNDINFESFQTSDSSHKYEIGGKGIGRFFWLKAFSSVAIKSVYNQNNIFFERNILFSEKDGIDSAEPVGTSDTSSKTVVMLQGFKSYYQKQPTAYKTANKISQRILEHCLSYFISDAVPTIIVSDGNDSFNLNTMFEQKIKNNTTTSNTTIGGYDFSLTHIKLYSTHQKMHEAVLCANDRDVESINLGKALGTNMQFDDTGDKFVYSLYVTSPYLNKYVGGDRLRFEIPEGISDEVRSDPQLSDAEFPSISKESIVKNIVSAAKEFLTSYLAKAEETKKQNVDNFIRDNPEFRSVCHKHPEALDELEPNSTSERIAEVLNRYKGQSEFQLRQDSEKILRSQPQSIDEFEPYYNDLKSRISEAQKDQLVSYLCDRKLIIALLQKKLELNQFGKYKNEDIIHDIIFPRKATTNDIDFESHNLWILDERLAFHDFAVSDRPLSDFTSSSSNERPDIVVFSETDDSNRTRTVSLFEFKKPQRKNFDQQPTNQLLEYLRLINGNKVKRPNGRDLIIEEGVRYYCYAICDITAAIETFAENNGYSLLQNKLGYYLYNSKLHAHIEIRAFDKILEDVKCRHKMFFKKLGIESY